MGSTGGERALRAALAGQWEFVPPPEAPVFTPSEAEFADPLAYIGKIRSTAEPYGICRIKPPERWRPPFALDIDSLRFVPRVQRLNELEGLARQRLHFRDRLQRYWRLRGYPLPSQKLVFEGKPLDLFALYHAVRLDGQNVKWARISSLLGFGHSALAATFVEDAYDRILAPFRDLLVDETISHRDRKPKIETDVEPKVETPAVAPGGMMRRIRKQKMAAEVAGSSKCNRELRRLACHGAGPKMPGGEAAPSQSSPSPPRRKRPRSEDEPFSKHECRACKDDDRKDELIVCAGCTEAYHTSCVETPVASGAAEWWCLPCVADEVKKPAEPFGFAQAEREYTLQEFGKMAEEFKANYFNMDGRLVSPVLAEKEFWRILSSADESVTVEYGADLHSMDHGSGFPSRSSLNLDSTDQEYVDSGWNLNNLPVLDNSVLRFINDDISGMTVPWMYVGMCFSSFCWHNEDHWSYSINYLHWGEAKTWYGVPGASAELLESTMKNITPELFHSQPDLLHQLVTIFNPNVLSEAGVPIYRTDQNLGEFVITFPRSYHAGFNQGYNFAEAVNFAPPDWLPIGRECVLHYKNLRRFCVFSHDELICKMALTGVDLDLTIVIPTYKELVSMVRMETKQRGEIFKNGVTKSLKRQFELLPDDERLCETCKTTCFLSAVACKMCPSMVCLDHVADMCTCPKEYHQLLYRYTLDELHIMLDVLKSRIGKFDSWMTEAKKIIQPNTSLINKASNIKRLLSDAKSLRIPKCKLLDKLIDEQGKILETSEPIIIELDD